MDGQLDEARFSLRTEWKPLVLIIGGFALFYFMPMDSSVFTGAILSGFALLNEYARAHVLTCLVPAFFIAGAISVFVRKDVIMRYLGSQANRVVSYSLAAVSGAVLAVCSCTILPIFAGISRRGAGLGPAVTFLFSGPAINIAAMFLTVSVLGLKLGLARIVAAVGLSVLVGLTMQAIFREKPEAGGLFVEEYDQVRTASSALVPLFAAMVGVLVVNGLAIDPLVKYGLMGALVALVAGIAIFALHRETTTQWLTETWGFTKMLLPLLFIGVFIAGFVMVFVPDSLVVSLVGENSLSGNAVAAIFGAFMYFSTLTEIPILQALIGKGMADGPALALLLAGPSLSLPNMLVIRKVLGTGKTAVYVMLVVAYATVGSWVFGLIW
ncbi:MAG: permease [Anaerosomatales bacterium]|nr:permease [Anaerosomatales bacterium]MDT8433930.1 permease [Anaerosomatales bacterium]